MSQGSNYKKQVMEALFNSPTNLINNKAIMWAASNLPDEGGNGSFKVKDTVEYNHDCDDVFDAVGITGDKRDRVVKSIQDIYQDLITGSLDEGNLSCKKSMVIERIFESGDESLLKFYVIFGVMKHHQDITEQVVKRVMEKKDPDFSMGTSISKDDDIPKDAPSEIRDLLKELIKLRNLLDGRKGKKEDGE
jgi:hypothetical protein